MPYYLHPPPQGPLARIVASIIAVFVLVGAVMLGMVALLVIAGLALVTGVAVWLRIIWIKRRLKNSGVDLRGEAAGHAASGHVIDAEYTVVDASGKSADGRD
jgi:hypothetical protein